MPASAMKADSWTAGPWSVCVSDGDDGGAHFCGCVSGADHPVATVTNGEWGDDYPTIRLEGGSLDRKAVAVMEQITYGTVPRNMALANARLIAAAPDMVEALRLCQRTLALLIAPDAIKNSTALTAYAQCVEAEAKARSALLRAGTPHE
jgi:hypothetical protein